MLIPALKDFESSSVNYPINHSQNSKMKLPNSVSAELWTNGMATASLRLDKNRSEVNGEGVNLAPPLPGEDLIAYINRVREDGFDLTLYRQVIGAANEFKEGDLTVGVAADGPVTRDFARTILANTTIGNLHKHALFEDGIYELIASSTASMPNLEPMTLGQLKEFLLLQPEEDIQEIMPGLSSDVIACVVKLMSNDELIQIGQKVFTPLPGSLIGSKGYMGARIQPNSPTDNTEDIIWQVFDGFSYAVGDVVLGTNPVSSEPDSVAKIAAALSDVITTFGLQDTLPHCVLAHIDVQAEAETLQEANSTTAQTGIFFQSLAGTVAANHTFDVSIAKMKGHASSRPARYGLYGETGQGADFTNGHAAGFDMVVHESRKYGFLRALKKGMEPSKWVHVNDVAGFIGPEVFKNKEQLVRCCLEDTVMGKLHGLTIGLDICSTLHMDVTLDDLDWCISKVMPANPAYLMALPTKNDPMLSYLTTSFSDHVRIRKEFGYKINDAMWHFFQRLGIIDALGQPTEHFGQPLWVYYQYRLAKGDLRTIDEIFDEGRHRIEEIQNRGVPIAQGYGQHIWEPPESLDHEVRRLYEDAKVSLWTELELEDICAIPNAISLTTQARDRQDYVYHPESGESLGSSSVLAVQKLRESWGQSIPDVQFVISDGLNVRALTDEGHLMPFLNRLRDFLRQQNLRLSSQNLVVTYGRVRVGYKIGEALFGVASTVSKPKGIIHIIGERPGTGHHNFSAYITVQPCDVWGDYGKVDHNVTRVVSGISDTAFAPEDAAAETAMIFERLWQEHVY